MTVDIAGVTVDIAGMTGDIAGMTVNIAGMTVNIAAHDVGWPVPEKVDWSVARRTFGVRGRSLAAPQVLAYRHGTVTHLRDGLAHLLLAHVEEPRPGAHGVVVAEVNAVALAQVLVAIGHGKSSFSHFLDWTHATGAWCRRAVGRC
jgi:hypothetical protein